MKVKIYNKLIRDKIPQIIEQSGKQAVVEKVTEEVYFKLLIEKLGEEHSEFVENQSVEELADLVEVIYAILEYKHITKEAFDVIRQQKFNERGAFNERLLLKEVIEG